MTENARPFLRVVVWKTALGYKVVGLRRGPVAHPIGNFHPTEEQAREAAQFIPRKHKPISLNDLTEARR